MFSIPLIFFVVKVYWQRVFSASVCMKKSFTFDSLSTLEVFKDIIVFCFVLFYVRSLWYFLSLFFWIWYVSFFHSILRLLLYHIFSIWLNCSLMCFSVYVLYCLASWICRFQISSKFGKTSAVVSSNTFSTWLLSSFFFRAPIYKYQTAWYFFTVHWDSSN